MQCNYCAANFWFGSDLFIRKMLGYLINRPVCFVSLVQCPFLEHKPSPHEARRFRLALFCSLLKVYSFWTCCVSILHQNATLHSLGSTATHPPCVKSIGWTVLDIIKMHTDRQIHTEIPAFIRSAPPSEASNIRCWLLPKLRSSKNGIRTRPTSFTHQYIVSRNKRIYVEKCPYSQLGPMLFCWLPFRVWMKTIKKKNIYIVFCGLQTIFIFEWTIPSRWLYILWSPLYSALHLHLCI